MRKQIKLVISFMILVGILASGISFQFLGNGKLFNIGCDVYASSNTITVNFPQSESQSRSQIITIPNLYSITDMTVSTGNVSHSVSGNDVTIYVSNGNYTDYVCYTRTESFILNSYSPNFAGSYWIDDGYYRGTVYATGSYSASVESGSPAGSKVAYGSQDGYCWTYYTYHTNTGWVETGTSSTNQPTISYGPDSDGYSGTLEKYDYYQAGDTGAPSGTASEGATYTRTVTYVGLYMGLVNRPDTRVWIYSQYYSGTLYTDIIFYYAYTVTVNYTTEVAPSISISSPEQNKPYSAQAGNNAIPLDGYVNDPDAGDLLKVYYRIDGSVGQAGTQYGSTISSNNSNQDFNTSSLSISVNSVIEENHTLYVWVEDNRGGKSSEKAIDFIMDTTAPVVNAPTLTAISDSGIEITPPVTSDPISNNVSSGMHSTPYMFYNSENVAISGWKSGSHTADQLSPNKQYTYKYKARDKVENTSAYSATASIYTLAAPPVLSVNNPKSYSLDISTSDANPSNTQYQIWTTTGGTKYVTSTGTLSSTAQWITLTNKMITVTGLSPNTAYTFNAKTRNGNNVPNQTVSTASNTTKVAPPGTPSGLNVSSNTADSITIGWNPVSGATGYDVEKDGTWVDNGSSVSYLHNSLTPGSTHTYRVRAKNAGDPSTSPPTSTLTAYTLPSIPGGVTVTPFTDHMDVSWNTVSGATGYDILIDNATIPTDNGTTLTYQHSSLLPNTQHSYKVRAKNHEEEGAYTNAITKYTLANMPNGGNITSVTNNSIGASWQANSNSSTTQYLLAAFSAGDVLLKQNAWSGSLEGVITGLSQKSTYIIKVKARNSENIPIETDWYTISSGTTTKSNTPLPPTGLTATVNSQSSITLTWNSSEYSTSYDIKRDDIVIANVTSLSYEDPMLSPNTLYKYKVRANNDTVSSEYCSEVSAATLPNPPGKPVVSWSSTLTSITLTWDAVENATGYKIFAIGIYGEESELGDITETTFTHSSLNKCTQYKYRVKACNTGGDGEGTDLEAYTLMDTPENVTASASNNIIIISWKSVMDASKYEVNIGNMTYTILKNGEILPTSYKCEGLNPFTAYTYKVRALNDNTSSAWSEERTKTTLPDLPAIPGNTTSTATKTTATLMWSAVSGATSYDVMADGQLYTQIKGTSFVQAGLAPGTEHTMQVRAKNTGGKSLWSSEVIITTLPDSPNVPANLNAIATVDTITIQWNAVAGAEYYEIEVDGTTPTALAVNEYVHRELNPGSTHKYRVRSFKQNVLSDWSTLITATTRSNSFAIPENINASASDTSVSISWDNVDGATGYNVEFNGIVINCGTCISPIFTGLQPETRHTYRVRMQNSGIPGDWSDTLSCVTLPGRPIAPVNFTAYSFENSIALSWIPVLDASSYEIMLDESTIQSTNNLEYVHEGLIPLTQHTYKIRSVNENGSGAWSKVITIFTLSEIPDVPGNIELSSTNNSIIIRWDKVERADSYDVKIDGALIENVIDTQYMHSDLGPATSHTYMVRAAKGTKTSAWSEITTKTTLPNKPTIPGNIVTTPSSDSVSITYADVIGVDGYDICFDGTVINNGNSTTFIKIGLGAGTQHSIRVRARNAGGASEWSSEMTVRTLARVLGIPQGLSASSDLNSIALTWNPLSGTQAYEIETNIGIVNVATNTQYTDNGLISGTQYSYRIRAVNEAGPGEWSGIITAATKLTTPSGINFVPAEDSILVTWNAVEGANTYDIEIDGTIAASVNTLSSTHVNVVPNQQHTYRIRARNTVVTGDWSNSITSQIPAQVYTGTFAAGEQFYFELNMNNVSNVENVRFIIAFDPLALDIIDLYSMTEAIDLATGDIEDSNIRVVQLSPGKIVLMIEENELPGELNGLVDIILFRAKNDGDVSITYSMN